MASEDSKKDVMDVSEGGADAGTSTGAGDAIKDKESVTDSKHEHMEVAECPGETTPSSTTTNTEVPGCVDSAQSSGTSDDTTPIPAGASQLASEAPTQAPETQCPGSSTDMTESPTSETSTHTTATTTHTDVSSTQTAADSTQVPVDTTQDGTTTQTVGDTTVGPGDGKQTPDQGDPGGMKTADNEASSITQAENCDVDKTSSNLKRADCCSETSETVEVKVVDFKVIFNKQKYDVTFPVNKTIAQLKDHVETLTGVPSPMQKIMYKGLAKDHCTLEDLKVTKGAKIMVVGSTMNDVLAVNNAPSKKEIEQEAKAATSKEPLSELKLHKKVLDKYGKPDDVMPGIKNLRHPLPPQPVCGMYNKSGGKVRLTFKLELDQVWLGTKERTEKLPMNSIKAVASEPIVGHEEYHLMALQLGPTEASRYWIYWVPAQYVDAIKDTVLGKWQFY